jgi:integrase
MASIYRKAGASGKTSPYWQAKLKGLDSRQLWLSTRLTNKKTALAVAERWESACRLAERSELTQVSASKILDGISALAKSPETVQTTRQLLAELLQHSCGEDFRGQDFCKFCAEWLSSKKNTLGEATWLKYRPTLHSFLESLHERRRTAPVSSISITECQRYRDGEIKAGKSAATVNLSMRVIRSVFTDARRAGIVATNPAEAVKPLPEDGEERIPFTEAAIRDLLSQADTAWRGMVLLGFHCGLRLSDAANLCWSNVDLETRTLKFEARKTSRRKKPSERTTTVYLHADLTDYFAALPGNDDPNAPLFPSLYGLPSSGTLGLSAAFMRLMARAKIDPQLSGKPEGKGRRFSKLSYHSLRHSFISRLANLEVSSDLRRILVGHADDEIHAKYTHLDLSLQAAAIGKLPSVL